MGTEPTATRDSIVVAGVEDTSELDGGRRKVVQASSVGAVADRVARNDVDCVVSEYRIGDRTVLDLLDRFQDTDSPPPVILWTDHGSGRVASQAVRAGVTEYVPRDATDLDATVSERVEQAIRNRRESLPPDTVREPPERPTEQSDGFVSIVDADGRFEYVSPAVDRTFGHDPEGMIGKASFDYVHPTDRERARTALQHVSDDPGATVTETLRFVDDDEEWCDVEVEARTLVSASSADRTVVHVRNVSDHRRTGTERSATEQTFRAVFEACSDAMVLVDDRHRFLEANPAACDLFGVQEAELLGESIQRYVPEDVDPTVGPAALVSDSDRTMSVPIVRGDGRRTTVEYSVTTDVLPGTHLATVRERGDSPDRGQSPSEIIDRVGDAFYAVNEAWEFTYVDEAAETVLGRDRETLLGRRLWDEFPEARTGVVWNEFHEAMETGSAREFELFFDPLDVHARVNVYPSETGLSVYFQDITERERAKRELEDRVEQQRAIAEFTQRVSERDSLDALFDDAADIVAEVFDNDYGEVLAYRSRDDTVSLRTGVGWQDSVSGTAIATEDLGSQWGYTLLSEDPVVVEDLETERRFSRSELLADHDVRSGITTTIGPSNDPWGIIGTHDTTRRSYDEHDVRFVEAIANALDAAIERREQERRLERYRGVVDTIDEAVWITDEDHRITFANSRTADALGYSRDALVGLPVEPLLSTALSVDDDKISEIVEGFQTLLDGSRELVRTEVPVTTGDGDSILDVTYTPLRRGGSITGIVGVARDITERQRRERDLRLSRRKYRTMFDAAPDPILTLDATTTEVVECNAAAERFWGVPREDLVGTDGSDLHPDLDAERYRDLFADPTGTPRTVSEREDGDPIEIETADGAEIPVSVSVELLEQENRTLLFETFRDESEHRWYETSLTTLYRTTQELRDRTTPDEIADHVVETASTVLDHSHAALYLYDEGDGVLRHSAASPETTLTVSEFPDHQTGDGVVWNVFETGDSAVFDDVRTADQLRDPDTSLRSVLVFPLGDHGVLVAADTRRGVYDQRSVTLTEFLASDATAALDRARRDRSLREQTSKLESKTQQFEEMGDIGSTVESATRDVIDANTGAEVEQRLCDTLSELDTVRFAMIATPADAADELVPSSSSGREKGYLDGIDLGLDGDPFASEPTTKAAATRSTVAVPNVADDVEEGNWKREALLRDFRSALSIPLTYNEEFYGVLSLYGRRPEALSFPIEGVLRHVAEVSAHAMKAVRTRNARLHSSVTELVFDVDDSTGVLFRLADRLECRIELLDIVPRPDDQYRYRITVDGVDPDEFRRAVDESFAVDSVSPVAGHDDTFEILSSEPGIARTTVELGGVPKSIVISPSQSSLTVELPETTPVRSFVKQLNETATLSLQSQKARDDPASRRYGTFLETLTDRQIEVLQTAHERGYFDRPRQATGQEVADALDISQPAFSKHLQKCEKSLFDSIFDHQ